MKPIITNAIEYNSWMTLLDTISNEIPKVAHEYGLNDMKIDVVPAYPRDLTKFYKPSIIVQKIYSSRSKLCMGDYIGQYHDTINDELYDMDGKLYSIQYQVNVDADGNTQLALLTEMVLDMISGTLQLGDYVHDTNNPGIIGSMRANRDGMTYVSSNDNKDYISFIRIEYSVVQTKIGGYPTVDLSKPIKFNQRVNI